jgi:hypothetical protein
LFPLIIIMVAIVGALGLTPFGLKFTDQQVILALLAFLGIDALVERLDILTNIEEKVVAVQKSITPKYSASLFLKKRRNFPRMEQLINEASTDIWVSGISLDTMITLRDSFETKLKQGCKIHFLALKPNGQAFPQAAAYYNWVNPESTAKRIESNLTTLYEHFNRVGKLQVEIRVLDRIVANGYFIVDHESLKARMIVQMYMYHTNTERAPLFELSKNDDEEWYSTFLHQYEEMWNAATPFQP